MGLGAVRSKIDAKINSFALPQRCALGCCSSNRLMRNFRTLNRTFWGRHLWARGYFVATSGNVTDDVIAKYIAEQDVEADDGEFKVTE